MKFFEKMKKVFKTKKSSTAGVVSRRGIDSNRDWRIILVSGFILMLLSFVFHAYLFYKIEVEGFFPVQDPMANTSVDIPVDSLKNIKQNFDSKQSALNKILDEGYNIIDPSK